MADSGAQPGGGAAGPGGRAHRRSAVAVLLLTVLGAIVPGVGLIVAGRVRSGITVLVATVVLAVALVLYVGTSTDDLLARALDPATLRRGAVLAIAVAVVWSAVTIASHRALRPTVAGTGERVGGSILVGLLCLGISTPLVLGANVLLTSREVLGVIVKEAPRTAITGQDTIGTPTATASSIPGATHPAATAYTWSKPRLNILLIGSDAGPDRTGTRTDSMVVASIDTATGKVLLVSVPRNLCRLQWDPQSALGKAYPYGWEIDQTGCTGNGDNLINALYNDVPIVHPGLLKSDNPGADALALGLSYSLKLPIDYFLAVDLTAFKVIVNSIGGVTVNINTPIPVGGSHNADGTVTYPTRWLMPGADQHLAGDNALWYARGRFYSDDFDRIARQKCMINAITHQANPTSVLTSYPSLASTLENDVLTDIPRKLLAPLAQLALKIKASGATSSITVDTASIPAMESDSDPHWDAAATAIAQAIRKTDKVKAGTAASPSTSASPSSSVSPSESLAQSLGVTPTASATTPTATTSNGSSVTTDVAAGCTYDSAVAQQNIALWRKEYGGMYDDSGARR